MSAREKAAGYVELSSRGCALLIGAYTSANRRALDYWKSGVAKHFAPGRRRAIALTGSEGAGICAK